MRLESVSKHVDLCPFGTTSLPELKHRILVPSSAEPLGDCCTAPSACTAPAAPGIGGNRNFCDTPLPPPLAGYGTAQLCCASVCTPSCAMPCIHVHLSVQCPVCTPSCAMPPSRASPACTPIGASAPSPPRGPPPSRHAPLAMTLHFPPFLLLYGSSQSGSASQRDSPPIASGKLTGRARRWPMGGGEGRDSGAAGLRPRPKAEQRRRVCLYSRHHGECRAGAHRGWDRGLRSHG